MGRRNEYTKRNRTILLTGSVGGFESLALSVATDIGRRQDCGVPSRHDVELRGISLSIIEQLHPSQPRHRPDCDPQTDNLMIAQLMRAIDLESASAPSDVPQLAAVSRAFAQDAALIAPRYVHTLTAAISAALTLPSAVTGGLRVS